MSNCGLLDGVIHQHVERCWKAGYSEGFDAGYKAAMEAKEDKPKRKKLPPLTGDRR